MEVAHLYFKNPFDLPKCIKKLFQGLNLPTYPEFSSPFLSEIDLRGRGRCHIVIQYTAIYCDVLSYFRLSYNRICLVSYLIVENSTLANCYNARCREDSGSGYLGVTDQD